MVNLITRRDGINASAARKVFIGASPGPADSFLAAKGRLDAVAHASTRRCDARVLSMDKVRQGVKRTQTERPEAYDER